VANVGSVKGRLLVANPALPDPNFHRTVVIMLDHGEGGALGVVLNRPSETAVGEPLPLCELLAAEPPVVFVGGPVEPAAAICLAEVDKADGMHWNPLIGAVGTVDLGDGSGVDDVMAQVHRLRVFAGYAGWGPGQVEDELAAGAWFVVDALAADVLSDEPRLLWRTVLRRQGGWLAALSSFPEDPTVN
jgi:putative transcriptional regulator